MTPLSIGRYRLVRKLGEGGMGEVYLAEDGDLQRLVAIKLVNATHARDETSRARLVAEARSAATLDHPNVCAIYEVGEHEGQPFFAMQYVEGETLADRLARGPLPAADVLRVASQIADALAEAHARGLVHRDIKPQNVIINPRGQVKVLDFGVAQRAAREDGATMMALTATGAVVGTTAYMSPEQLRGEVVDPSTDVFSFGCLVHEMVNGRHPFARTNSADTIAAILASEPPALAPSAGTGLRRIVQTCLQKERTRRYANAGNALADLRTLPETVSPFYSTQAGSSVSSPALGGRRGVWRSVAAMAAVAGLAATAWAVWSRLPAAGSGVQVIAILPLATESDSSSYLGDGISESVINSLSRLPNIKVLGRTTTFRYRGDVDPAVLRRDLGVQAVLTGRVQQQGDGLVVQAELINTADNSQIWGERYTNRRLADVFEVQEEIARAIASSLRLELAGHETAFSKRYTADVEAYRSYILGREFAQRRTREDLLTALDHYRRAIARDDQYALAYAGAADAYITLISRGALTASEGRRLARDAAERAMTLDPGLAESNAAMGQMHVYAAPYDFETGDRALRRAIAINPGWAIVRQNLAVSLLEQGKLDEGMRELEVAHQLDPLSAFITRFLAFARLLKGDAQGALSLYRSAGSQTAAFATFWDAEIFVAAGAIDEGLAELARASVGRETDLYIQMNRAMLAAAKGDRATALAVATEFERQAADSMAAVNFAARARIALGDTDRGLEWLQKSIDADAMSIFYKDQLSWQPVRNDPRFKALLARMRIPDP